MAENEYLSESNRGKDDLEDPRIWETDPPTLDIDLDPLNDLSNEELMALVLDPNTDSDTHRRITVISRMRQHDEALSPEE